jgi:hypothetical protein
LEKYILLNLSELLQPKDKRKTILLTSWVNPFGLILIIPWYSMLIIYVLWNYDKNCLSSATISLIKKTPL